jgi:hypothetical protein
MPGRGAALLCGLGAGAVVVALAALHAQQGAPPAGGAGASQPPRLVPGPFTGMGPGGGARVDPGRNLMSNPYRMVESWPALNPDMQWGPAMPDHNRGTWALLRTRHGIGGSAVFLSSNTSATPTQSR